MRIPPTNSYHAGYLTAAVVCVFWFSHAVYAGFAESLWRVALPLVGVGLLWFRAAQDERRMREDTLS